MNPQMRTAVYNFEVLGQHVGCGGEVVLMLSDNAGRRYCRGCGGHGTDCADITPTDDVTLKTGHLKFFLS